MAVIIGNSTTVTVAFNNGPAIAQGITSVEWSTGTQPQRLYTLGMGSANCGPREFAVIRKADVNVSFSIYGGITPAVSTCTPQVCANSPASAIITIVPAVCSAQGGPPVAQFNRQVYFSSYSYNKDRVGFGTESWQGNAYASADPITHGQCREYIEPAPTYVALGMAEGTIEGEISDITKLQNITGARFREDACLATTSRGSVQASQMSLGDYMLTTHGTFRSIGNSEFWNPKISAKASVSLSLQPIYLGS